MGLVTLDRISFYRIHFAGPIKAVNLLYAVKSGPAIAAECERGLQACDFFPNY